MKKYILDLTVNSVEALSDKHVLIKLTDDKPLPEMLPGQFVEVRVDNSPSTFLRRPISINNVDYDHNELWLLVAAVGDGTRQLQKLQKGDRLNCVLPLGNSFTMPTDSTQKVLLVGGGVGVAPLLYFGKRIKAMGGEPTFLLGARSAKDVLERELFEQVGQDIFKNATLEISKANSEKTKGKYHIGALIFANIKNGIEFKKTENGIGMYCISSNPNDWGLNAIGIVDFLADYIGNIL